MNPGGGLLATRLANASHFIAEAMEALRGITQLKVTWHLGGPHLTLCSNNPLLPPLFQVTS